MPKRPWIYVGLLKDTWKREVFTSFLRPISETHGHLYGAVIGPFRTKRGATFMTLYGRGNPHVQNVADAERLAKKEAQREPRVEWPSERGSHG